jgi:hypothetical protein
VGCRSVPEAVVKAILLEARCEPQYLTICGRQPRSYRERGVDRSREGEYELIQAAWEYFRDRYVVETDFPA